MQWNLEFKNHVTYKPNGRIGCDLWSKNEIEIDYYREHVFVI